MTFVTVKERAASFPLDQLLTARRRGTRICLICGDMGTPMRRATCDECLHGTGAMLPDPEDLIVFNHGPRP